MKVITRKVQKENEHYLLDEPINFILWWIHSVSTLSLMIPHVHFTYTFLTSLRSTICPDVRRKNSASGYWGDSCIRSSTLWFYVWLHIRWLAVWKYSPEKWIALTNLFQCVLGQWLFCITDCGLDWAWWLKIYTCRWLYGWSWSFTSCCGGFSWLFGTPIDCLRVYIFQKTVVNE